MSVTKKDSLTPFEFDSRMVEWNLKHKVITRDQLSKYRDSLTDSSGNTEAVIIEDTNDTADSNSLN